MVVTVDFSNFSGFQGCPQWWQNFVNSVIRSGDWRNGAALEEVLRERNVGMVDDENLEDIDHLIFESAEARDEFILFWTLYGGK